MIPKLAKPRPIRITVLTLYLFYMEENLKTKLGIPCGKDMYYDRYRKFFWLLNNSRD